VSDPEVVTCQKGTQLSILDLAPQRSEQKTLLASFEVIETPFAGKLIKHTAENTTWAKSRKYNMGQKQKKHAEANAENTSGPHDESHMVAAAGGGRHHMVRGGQSPFHIMWAARIFSICLRIYFLLLPHNVFSAFGPH